MPKYNRHFHGDPTQVLERLDQEIRKAAAQPGGHDHCPDDRWARIMPFCRGERWQTGADLLVSCTS